MKRLTVTQKEMAAKLNMSVNYLNRCLNHKVASYQLQEDIDEFILDHAIPPKKKKRWWNGE